MTTLPTVFGNIGGAAAAVFYSTFFPGAPGGEIVGAVTAESLNNFFERRHNNAREIWIEEVRLGQKSLIEAGHEDEALSIIERYLRAAREGAARLNLRLMARIVAGQAERGNLIADEFLYYADLLASLRREEVIVLATMYRHWVSPDNRTSNPVERKNQTKRLTQNEIVPAILATQDDFVATLGSLMRTGLVIGATQDGLFHYPSPLLEKLIRLCPLDEVLSREGVI